MELVRAKNVATYIVFPLKKNDGSLLSGAAGLDSEIDAWSDGGAPDGFSDCSNEATEIASTGIYYLSLSQSEMNYDYILIQVKSSTTGAIPQIILICTKAHPMSEVTLASSQGSYAPAKAGDAMTLSAAYDAAKTAAPTVDAIDTKLSGTHGAGAWGASAVGTIAYPAPIDPFLDANDDPIVGVKIECFSNAAMTALVDVQVTDINGNFQFHLNAGEYWFRASMVEYTSYEWSEVLA